jgi:replicative DNA helicase
MMSDLRESGCLAGDTLIKDAETGHLYTIKELAERREQTPIQVFAIDKDLKLGAHTMTKAFYSGRKVVCELKMRSGRKIKASANHPFLQLEGWTRLDQLKPGSHIAIPRELKTESNQPMLQKEELIFIGHLLGDGCILPDQPYHYTSADPENIQYVQEASEKLFSIMPRVVHQELANSGIYWDEITSIVELGEEDVYDATVPEVHNFVANDIVVHNSLEQDSDVVMFLFRRDYYDKHDKPGLAEIIVAKNRHGGVGDVLLTFRKEVGQFANYTPINAQADVARGNREAFAAFSPEE